MLVLEVEDLRVVSGGGGDESGVKELEDFVANVGELRLNPGQKASPKWVTVWVLCVCVLLLLLFYFVFVFVFLL